MSVATNILLMKEDILLLSIKSLSKLFIVVIRKSAFAYNSGIQTLFLILSNYIVFLLSLVSALFTRPYSLPYNNLPSPVDLCKHVVNLYYQISLIYLL